MSQLKLGFTLSLYDDSIFNTRVTVSLNDTHQVEGKRKDQYDEYYHHLFIYDTQKMALVGAYRCGDGKKIYAEHGIKGFYLNELFDFNQAIRPIFEDAMELGRAFITVDYQKMPASLFLLWKGLIMIAMQQKFKYMIGGVSISDSYSELSKSIIIDFIQSYHFDNDLAKLVKAKQPFKVELTSSQKELIQKDVQNNVSRLDKLIDEIELQPGMNIPVLLKKHLKQNAKLFGFNIDPNFNNAVDGLMYVNVDELPEATIKSALEKFKSNL